MLTPVYVEQRHDNTMARTSSNTKPRSSKPAKAKVAGVTKKKVRFAEPLTLSTTNATLVELMARHNHAKPADATTIKARPKAPLITIPMDVFNDVLATTIKKEAVDPNIAEEVAVDHSGTAPSTSNKKVGRSQTRPRPSSSTPSTAPSLFLPTSYSSLLSLTRRADLKLSALKKDKLGYFAVLTPLFETS